MNNEHKFVPKNINKAFQRQACYTCIAYTTYFLLGIMRGYPTFLLRQLQSEDSLISFQPSSSQASLIASLSIFPNPFGSVLAGFLMDKWGRKMTLQLSMLLFAAGWAIVALSQNLMMLYGGIIIGGIAIGMGVCSPIYVAEISEVQNRCMLLSFLEVFYSLGILISYVSTCYLKWNIAASIFTIISIISLFLFLWVPETPYWLIKRNRLSDAMSSLVLLRTNEHPEENEVEFKTLSLSLEQETEEKVGLSAIVENLKPLVILVLIHILLHGTGYMILLTFLTDFLADFPLNLRKETQELVAIGYSVASFVASFITPLSVNYWPRREATILSGVGISLTMACLGAFSLYSHSHPADSLWFVVPVCLYLYMLASTVGVLTLSQAMISELYPTEVRGMMCGVTEAIGTMLSGILVHIFPIVKNYVNIGEVLLFFASFGILTIIYGKYILPETYGKSLTQIQREYFRRGSSWACNRNDAVNEVKLEVVSP